MYGHSKMFVFVVFFNSQLSCYFKFEVTDKSEKILLQVVPYCFSSDELSVDNGNEIYLDFLLSKQRNE